MTPEKVVKPVFVTWTVRAVMVFVVRLSLPLRENGPDNVRLFVPPMVNVKLLVPVGNWMEFAMVWAPPAANNMPLPVVVVVESTVRYNGPVPTGPLVTGLPAESIPKPMAPLTGNVPPE